MSENCVDIISHFYEINVQYLYQFIGQSLAKVIRNLPKEYIALPYRICDLTEKDVVFWESKRDKNAHITVFSQDRFFYTTPDKGLKSYAAKLQYRRISIRPKYIIRKKEG